MALVNLIHLTPHLKRGINDYMENIRRYQLSDEMLKSIAVSGGKGDSNLNTKQGNSNNNLHPLLQRIYAARKVSSIEEVDYNLAHLLPHHELSGVNEAVSCLYDGLLSQKGILIIGDFDVDGATSTVLAILALRAFGFKQVEYLIPNRFEFGYGLTPEIVAAAKAKYQSSPPEIIITVDNGIASHDGVLAARNAGIKVIITDHHLPSSLNPALPEADAIINPNKTNDEFQSKNLAGVGVIFYLLLALRGFLREKNWFDSQGIAMPNMAQFLDLVALGTVADLVPLDYNNRILVHHGLARIRAGQCRLGLKTLLSVARRDYTKAKVDDLVYAIAPRLNAAGRLDDMSLGVACLLSDHVEHARLLARELNNLNDERRVIEANMQQQAMQALARLQFNQQELPHAICIFDETWHQGVIGILASKLKERFHKPTAAFAAVSDNEIKGSVRSVAGLNMRDVLESISSQHPELIIKFGGHAMAAGLSLRRGDYGKFHDVFTQEIKRRLQEEKLEHYLYTDGELSPEYFSLETAELLQQAGPWGHSFPEPLFDGIFDLVTQRVVGERHLKMTLRVPETTQEVDAIHFNINTQVWPNFRANKVHAVYRLDVNEFNGRRSLQLMVEKLEPYGVV